MEAYYNFFPLFQIEVEFYFGNANLQKDRFMKQEISKNPDDVSITNNKSKLAFLQIKVVNAGAITSEKNQDCNLKKIMTEAMSMVKFSWGVYDVDKQQPK